MYSIPTVDIIATRRQNTQSKNRGNKNAIYIRMVSVKAAIPYNISPLKPCMVPSMLPNA